MKLILAILESFYGLASFLKMVFNPTKVSNEVSILIPFIFAVERTLFYISKAWFYREFFPKG